MREYKINRESIKHLLETPPCVGVDITETPMTLVEKAGKIFAERKHEYIMECLVKADIDPDALIKTTKKNQELMQALAELYKKIEDGTLVELPCKIGDDVWACLNNYISKAKVWGISTESYLYERQIYLKVRTKDKTGFVFDKNLIFEKTVFLTREEAQKALYRADRQERQAHF